VAKSKKPRKPKLLKKWDNCYTAPWLDPGTVYRRCFYCGAEVDQAKGQPGCDREVVCSICRGDQAVDLTPGTCQRCPLCAQPELMTNRMPGYGATKPRILIVGEAPGRTEDKSGMPFVGKAGELLRGYLQEVGIPDEAIAFTNVVRCCPIEGKGIRSPEKFEIMACRYHIQKEIVQYDPEIVLVLGNSATQSLLGKKNITQIRGKLHTLDIAHFGKEWFSGSYRCLPVIHPSAVLRGNTKYGALIVQDLRYAWDMINGTLATVARTDLEDIEAIEEQVDRWIAEYQAGKWDYLSVDTEASSEGENGGLEIFHSTFRMLCVTIAPGWWEHAPPDEHAYFIPYRYKHGPFAGDLVAIAQIDAALNRLFRAVPVAGQNFQYDHTVFHSHTATRIPGKNVVWDTMLAAWSISNDTEQHDLDYLATNYGGWSHPKQEMYEAQMKLRKDQDPFEDVPPEVFKNYACGDVVAVSKIIPVQKRLMESVEIPPDSLVELHKMPGLYDPEIDKGLIWAYKNLSLKSHPFAVQMRINGVFVDRSILNEVREEQRQQVEDFIQWFVDAGYEQALTEMCDYKLVLNGWQSMNLMLHGVMGLPYIPGHYKEATDKILTSRGYTVQGETNKDTIELHIEYLAKCQKRDPANNAYYEQSIAALHKLLDYRTLNKHYTSYVLPLERLIGWDGCTHSCYNIRCTGTGRWSATDPAIQTVPREGIIKKVYISRFVDGLLCMGDYSQMELREGARKSGEERWLIHFRNHADIHTMNAAMYFAKLAEEVTKEERSSGKATTFGVMYGMKPATIAATYHIPLAHAEMIYEAIIAQCTNYKKYMDNCEDFVKTHKCIWTSLGHRRLLPDIDDDNRFFSSGAVRAAINTPIQGDSSDLATLALQQIHEEIEERRMWSRLWEFIHDSIGADTPIFELYDYMALQQWAMVENLPQCLPILNVPLEVEFDVGLNWYETIGAVLLPDRQVKLKAKGEKIDVMKQILRHIKQHDSGVEMVYSELEEEKAESVLTFPEVAPGREPVWREVV